MLINRLGRLSSAWRKQLCSDPRPSTDRSGASRPGLADGRRPAVASSLRLLSAAAGQLRIATTARPRRIAPPKCTRPRANTSTRGVGNWGRLEPQDGTEASPNRRPPQRKTFLSNRQIGNGLVTQSPFGVAGVVEFGFCTRCPPHENARALGVRWRTWGSASVCYNLCWAIRTPSSQKPMHLTRKPLSLAYPSYLAHCENGR